LVRAREIATVVPDDPGGHPAGHSAVGDLRGPRFLNDSGGLKAAIHDIARAHGFDVAGVVRPDALANAKRHLAEFLAAGAQGDMHWMDNAERRGDPHVLWPDVRSIIMLGVNYGPDEDPLAILSQRTRGAISVYARGDDYHEVIKPRLKAVARALIARAGGDVKVFVDTAAVMEKPLAAAAGLGWQGKHTNLVSREFGSWLFLGAIFTTLELPPDAPEQDYCGTCRACLDVCPTEAFPAPYRLDARRCISYLTIEHKGPIPHDLRPRMGNRIYGCDDCLAVCPWNKFAQQGREAKLAARAALTAPRLGDLARLDDRQFRALFAKTTIKRTGRDRFVRNVLIAIGNSGDEALADEAERLVTDPAPLVRGAAIWALGRLAPQRLAASAAQHRTAEADVAVAHEWAVALGEAAA
jgi:epoxyqueuosine reductase